MPTATKHPVLVARKAKGWSQEKLAREIEMSRETVAQIEKGNAPRVETALKIARALGKSLDELFGEQVA